MAESPKRDEPRFKLVEKRFKVDSSGKRKELVVRLSQETLEKMVKEPPHQPAQRLVLMDLRSVEVHERFLARDKVAREAREKVLKQYKEHGYGDMILEISDDEEEY